MECFKTFTEVLEQFIELIFGPGTQVIQLPSIPKLNESVYEFYSPENGRSPNLEVVFFHGLARGDYSRAYVETWTSFDGSTPSCWPKIWLAEKFPSARILSVSYDSSIIKGRSQGRLDLYCTAENLIQDLMDMQGKVAVRDGCPLILVGHGLGGLIIKAVCREAKHQLRKTFLTNLKGILFYSTPHFGLSNLPAEFDGELAETLGWGNRDIARLNEDFRSLRQENKWVVKAILAGSSGQKLELGGTEASVRMDVDYFYTAKEDIDAICRPQVDSSISYTYLTDLIDSVIMLQNKAGTQRGLKSVLPFEDDQYYVPMQKTIDEVRSGLKKARIIVVHGAPGSGKSSLARHLALQFEEESQRQRVAVSSTSDPACSFPDGVVYLSCGNGAHIIHMQRELLGKIGVDAPLPEAGFCKDELSQKLQEILIEHLRGLSALVVLHDVWDHDLLQKISVHCGKVKYLVTTQFPLLCTTPDSKRILIQDVAHKDARKILANYAKFDSGVIPVELEDLADSIIAATMSHPLALATLGTIIDSRRDTVSSHNLPDLKDDFLECLGTDRLSNYPLDLHASMMVVVGLLEDDAKLLLYIIVLFDGTSIPEAFVRLLAMYAQSKAGLKNVTESRRSLELRGLVQLELKPVLPYYAELVKHNWKTLSIHGLRRQAILTKEEENIDRITNFLDGDTKFLSWGRRSDCDLAIAICALYGVTAIKERAVIKMGRHFKWSEFDDIDELANTLRVMVSIMFMEGTTSSHKARITKAATEVFWKMFTKGELDDKNISSLLDIPECTQLTCAFVAEASRTFLFTRHELSVVAFPRALTKLLLLLSDDTGEALQLQAILAISHLSIKSENALAILQLPRCLEAVAGLMAQHVSELIQERALMSLSLLTSSPMRCNMINQVCIDILATPSLLERLVMLLSKDMKSKCKLAASTMGSLASFSRNRASIAGFPSCLQRLAELLAEDVDRSVQEEVLRILSILAAPTSDDIHIGITQVRVDILATPGLFERVVMLSSKDMGDLQLCEWATRAISHLSLDAANMAPIIAKSPSCLHKLVDLVAEDVDKSIQESALAALVSLASLDETEVGINIMAIPGLLDRLVVFLSKDVGDRPTCMHATVIVAKLVFTSPSRAAHIVGIPSLLERFVGLLAQDVDTIIQRHAVICLNFFAKSGDNQVCIDMVGTPGLLGGLVNLLSQDFNYITCPIVVGTLSELARAPQNKRSISLFPMCLERLVGLLASSADKSIQVPAMCALAFLTEVHAVQDLPINTEILATRDLLKTVMLFLPKELSKDMQGIALCEGAAIVIKNLALAPQSQVTIVENFPSCLEVLGGVIAGDWEKTIQEHAVWALANLSCADNNQLRINIVATPGLLENVIGLLSEDLQGRCEAATVLIRNLALTPPNPVTIVENFPFCLEMLGGLLAEDVGNNIQEHAVWALANLACADSNQLRTDMLASPGLLGKVVRLLSPNMESRCQGAARMIRHLAVTGANQRTILKFPLCYERLVELLDADVDSSIRKEAASALAYLGI